MDRLRPLLKRYVCPLLSGQDAVVVVGTAAAEETLVVTLAFWRLEEEDTEEGSLAEDEVMRSAVIILAPQTPAFVPAAPIELLR